MGIDYDIEMQNIFTNFEIKKVCSDLLQIWLVSFQILDQIDEYGISIYPLPDCDSDEDEDYREQCRQLKVCSIHSSY